MMRDRLILIVLATLWPALFFAQKHDYVWEMGQNYTGPDTGYGGTTIDFNENPIRLYRTPRIVHFTLTNASISDAEGNLKYYTNGCAIYNDDDEVIQNGDDLNPGFYHDWYCDDLDFGYLNEEAAMFFPLPGSSDHYVLFHQDYDTIRPIQLGRRSSLRAYYTIVGPGDGSGQALEKNVLVMRDSFISGFMPAVKHRDLSRWWVLLHGRYSNKIHKFLITGNGAEYHSTQESGPVMGDEETSANQAVFTPVGTKLISYNPTSDLLIWDFDRETGALSNLNHIAIQDSGFTSGVAVSSNSRFVYVSSFWDLYQFDLWASDVAASKIHIGHYDGFMGPFPTRFGKAQLAPDCRIYILSTNGDRWMHVIHHPNRKGLACDFRQHDLQLPTVKGYRPVLNFPNYRLDTGPVCDSSLMLTAIPTIPRLAHVKIYPNPTSGQITIESGDLSQYFTYVVVYDMMGREVIQRDWSGVSDLQLDLADAPGTYFVVIREEGSVVFSETVVVN